MAFTAHLFGDIYLKNSDANPNQTNPYVPWRGDPTGLLISPLALLALVYTGNRKRSKLDVFVALLVVCGVLSLSLAGCGPSTPGDGTPYPSIETPFGYTDTPTPGTVNPSTPTPGGTPIGTPTYECTPTPSPTPNSKNWFTNPFVITHYATVLENDSFFTMESDNDRKYVPFYEPPFVSKENIHYELVPRYAFYVGNQCDGNCGNWRVSFQGSGKLTEPSSLSLSGGKEYVQADTNKEHLPDTVNGWQPSAVYYFTNQPQGACGSGFPLKPDATIAVPYSLFSFVPDSGKFACGEEYYIEGYGETKFMVTDRGTFDDPNHFDIYVGPKTFESFYNDPSYQNTGAKYRVAKAKP